MVATTSHIIEIYGSSVSIPASQVMLQMQKLYIDIQASAEERKRWWRSIHRKTLLVKQ